MKSHAGNYNNIRTM